MQHLACPLEIKDSDADTLVMLAAAYGNIDRGQDCMLPGAVKNAQEFVRGDGYIFWDHDRTQVLASPKSARDTAAGFEVTAEWHTTPMAQQYRTIVKERLARGKQMGCSIGYVPIGTPSMQWIDGKSVRILDAVNVFEVSLCPVPMNPKARVLDAKGGRVFSESLHAQIGRFAETFRRVGSEMSEMLAEALAEEQNQADGKALTLNDLKLRKAAALEGLRRRTEHIDAVCAKANAYYRQSQALAFDSRYGLKYQEMSPTEREIARRDPLHPVNMAVHQAWQAEQQRHALLNASFAGN